MGARPTGSTDSVSPTSNHRYVKRTHVVYTSLNSPVPSPFFYWSPRTIHTPPDITPICDLTKRGLSPVSTDHPLQSPFVVRAVHRHSAGRLVSTASQGNGGKAWVEILWGGRVGREARSEFHDGVRVFDLSIVFLIGILNSLLFSGKW
jgi:hypothetical protein